ncbi:MAG: metal ABC transporter substrate-binding protein [Phycisphaerales bacterium]|nr:metal ABC transporter substrate-binding protein [Phycisphaerales bacterium]
MRRWSVLTAWALGLAGVCVAAVSCTGREEAPPTAQPPWPAPLNVVVSIPPLKGLIEPLLPPGSTITVLIPPGVSEHGYEIPPRQLKEAINADLLVWIGGMEPAVDKLAASNPRASRTDLKLADALKLHIHAHDHGAADHDHADHHGDDPHIWLDPAKAKEIVRAVADKVKLLRTDTDGKHEADSAASALDFKLNTLDADFKSALAPAKVRTIVVGHDAFGWLAKRYDLKTVAISGLNASEPTPGDLQKAKEAVRANGLKAVFKEPQLSDAAAKRIADETGVKVLTLDPLGDGDYFKMMRANLAAIRTALGLQSRTDSPAPR